MKYVIRKVPERDTSYLERLLPEALIYCDDKHEGCRASFEKAILLADDDAVYVQDDMILCKGFKEKAEAYIARYPSHCIVFSNQNYSKESEDVTAEGFWSAKKGAWLMCTYIPKEMAKAFLAVKKSKNFKRYKNVERFDLDDVEFEQFLTFMGEKVFVVVPNLAGHPRNKSVTKFKRASRICQNFDYENAEQKGKLS